MSNYIKYYLRSAFYSVALLFTSTSVIQIFLTELGITSTPIGIFTSLLSVVNVLTNIGFSAYADRCHHVKRTISLLCIPIGCCFLLLLPLCLSRGLDAGVTFLLTAAVCLIQMLFITMYSVLEYKLPYSIIDVNQYGRFSSINGIIVGIASTAASYVLSKLLESYPYFTVLSIGFGVGGGFMFLASVINSTLDTSRGLSLSQPGHTDTEKNSIFAGLHKIMRSASFRRLLLPNFFRGFHMGMLNVAAVIAVSCGFDTATASRLVTVTFLGNILGSVVYMTASGHIESRKLCLTGSIVTCVGVLLPFGTPNVFLAVYFVMVMGKILVDYAIPSQVYAAIKPDIACLYQTWRLIVTTAGSVLSAAVSGFFIEYISVTGFLVIASVCQVICGVSYFRWRSGDK